MKSIIINNRDNLPKNYTGHVKHEDGTQEWYKNDKLHREDGPAVIRTDGTQEWYLNGRWHREDGPAVIRTDGTQKWYLDGRWHREDGPAITYPDGTQEWWVNGKQHNPPNPPKETPTIKSNKETSPLVSMYKTARNNLLEQQCKMEYHQGYIDALKEVSKSLNIKLD